MAGTPSNMERSANSSASLDFSSLAGPQPLPPPSPQYTRLHRLRSSEFQKTFIRSVARLTKSNTGPQCNGKPNALVSDPDCAVDETMHSLFVASLITCRREVQASLDAAPPGAPPPPPAPPAPPQQQPSSQQPASDAVNCADDQYQEEDESGFLCPLAHEWFRRKGVGIVVKNVANRSLGHAAVRLCPESEEVCSTVLVYFCEWALRLMHMQHKSVIDNEEWIEKLTLLADNDNGDHSVPNW